MTTVEKIKAALEKHEPGQNQFVKLTAEDVVEVAGKVPKDAHDDVTRALLTGAKSVGPGTAVFQKVDHVAHLIAKVGG